MARKQVEITEEQYLKAIELLESGATKKAACEALGIAYNTKRLTTLIEEFQHKIEVDKRIRAEKRTKAVTKDELASMVEDYLAGASFEALSQQYYRSAALIRFHLDNAGALLRQNKTDYFNPSILPDECVTEEFQPNEYVWSTRYNCVCQVVSKYKNAYRVWVLNEGIQQQSYQEPWELGSLRHLEKLGVQPKRLASYRKGNPDTKELEREVYGIAIQANKR